MLWEHSSFKEQGIDREPTIHIGAVANALEHKGIQTERGNINREIIKHNMMLERTKAMLEFAKQEVHSAQYAKINNAAASVKNEVLEMIGRVQEKMGRLALPIVSAKYLAKIPNRDKVQDVENAKNFLERNNITTFAQLEKYRTDKGKEFDRREQIFIPKWQRLEQLKELAKAYADYEPYKAVHDMSKSLSGLKKLKYDKEHEHDLAFAEVISYNKANLERVKQNENRQQTVSKTVGRAKRREEEI